MLYKLILILTFLFNFNSKANEFNFVKTIITDGVDSLSGATQISSDSSLSIMIYNEYEDKIVRKIAMDNDYWYFIQKQDISEGVEKLLSIYNIENRQYFHVKYNDGYQQLLCIERNPDNFNDAWQIIYPKFKFGGDTIIEPNRLVKLRDSILIAYSTKENESNKYQFHRFGFEDGSDKYDYAVKGLLQGEKHTPVSTFKDVIKIFNHEDKRTTLAFFNDSTYNIFYGQRDLFLDYQTIDHQLYNVVSRSFGLIHLINEQIYLNVNIVYEHIYLNNGAEQGYLSLSKEHFENSSPDDTINKQIVFKKYIDSDGNDEDIISLEIPLQGEYISDVYDYNNTLMFLFKENETGNVNIYYSKDDGDTWNFEETPELNNSETLEMCYYNNQIYAYNKDNIFVTDFTSSVENNINESNIIAFANNSTLFVKSSDNVIRQITLIDILGNELYSSNVNNQKELKIPVNLTNYNLLICKVTTQNEVKVLKLIKGEY